MPHDLVRPPKARRGDRVAVLSPSFAAAGAFPAVHEQVMRRLAGALHPASAVPAVQPPAQDVRVSDPLVRLAAGAPGAPGVAHDGLCGLEIGGGDQRSWTVAPDQTQLPGRIY